MDLSNINKEKRRKAQINIGDIIYGKVPPQAKQIENDVLGTLMVSAYYGQEENSTFDFNAVVHDVTMILKAEDFYVEAHQRIYKAIIDLNKTGAYPTSTMVAEKLKQTEELEMIGGAYYLTSLTNNSLGHKNLTRQCRIIKQYSIARRLIILSGSIMNDAYDDSKDALDLLSTAEQHFFEINTELQSTRVRTTELVALDLAEKYMMPRKLTDEEIQKKYLYTGMADWDRINGPLFMGGVYVVAARPAMGKTAFAIQLVKNMSRKFPVGLINVEMTDAQLAQRTISNLVEFDNYNYKIRAEDWEEPTRKHFYRGLQEFMNLQLFIESDTTDIDQVVQKIRFWVRRHGVRVVMIDYLQILRVSDELGKYMSDTQALNYILEKIRACAKELNIVIFLLSQLNRELYRRAGNKEPNLGDLKGSGKIEEIAYQISFLHRPEYYDPEATVDEFGESTKDLCYQIIAKNRDGETGRVKHKFVARFTRFEEWVNELPAWVPINTDTKPAVYTQPELPTEPLDDLPF